MVLADEYYNPYGDATSRVKSSGTVKAVSVYSAQPSPLSIPDGVDSYLDQLEAAIGS